MPNLGKLTEIKDLHTVWPHEALDFTPWLAEEGNISLLADAVGIEITVEETESDVGSFNVDIYATETGTDRKIIIENQLEDTDHDHLGKCITYAAGKSAAIIIWVVKRAREEHRAAIEWLNGHTDEKVDFFLVETKLYQIGDSDIAVKFEVVEKPNNWVKEIKQSTGNSPTMQARYEYWTAFNEYACKNVTYSKTFGIRKASTDHWMTLSVGTSACGIVLSQVRKYKHLIVEWCIWDDKELYRKLYAHKEAIESEMGIRFEWCELPDKKSSRILAIKTVDFDNRSDWSDQFTWMTETAVKMKNVFKKYL